MCVYASKDDWLADYSIELPYFKVMMNPKHLDEAGQPRRYSRGRTSRGKGLRKTTGCLTCRRRHVKCDEDKPRCGACTRRRITCEYSYTKRGMTSSDVAHQPRRQENNTSTSGNLSSDTEPAAKRSDRSRIPETSRDEATRMGSTSPASLRRLEASPREDRHENTMIDSDIPNGTNSNLALPEGPVQESPASGQQLQTSMDAECISALYGPQLSQVPSYHALLHFTGTPAHSIESPTSRWLDLLIGDATLQNGPLPEYDVDSNGLNIFGNSVVQSPASNPEAILFTSDGERVRRAKPGNATRNAYLNERAPYVGDQQREELAWRASDPIELQQHEMVLFRHFSQHISKWMDLLEPQCPFGTLVPHLAIHNVGLMNAILALSARHLSLHSCELPAYVTTPRPDPNDAVGYYLKTLQYSQKAMHYDTYKISLELLAISIIVSTYEMLDGSSTNWEKHLEGVFWIQRSQTIHGDSGGLRQAVWWAWLCQDAWAAFRERRKPFTFWRPAKTLAELNPAEIAARAVYNFAQVVGFCSRDAVESRTDIAARTFESDMLLQQLEDWRSHLTLEFEPLPLDAEPSEIFPSVWIQPAAFGVAMQVYYCSLILVELHRPVCGGLDDYLERRRQLNRYAKIVCGIARTLTIYAPSIMSSQCVFIAGISLEDERQQNAVLDLLEICRKRSGWPEHSLSYDLNEIWQKRMSYSPV